jgi:starvation-inducible DNA-binding protein
MTRFLACLCVLVGVALTVAAGSDPPAKAPQNGEAKKAPQNGEAKSQPQKATQVPSPHAFSTPRKPQRISGESNGFALQPGRVEYSYPLKGDTERSKSVKALQQLTVDLLALHSIYKEAHWDLTGPLFVSLHEYFQQQADFYLQQADLFAERVLHLGAYVDGRFSTVARTTRLAELPDGYLTDDHALKLLLDRVTVLQKAIYDLIGETEASDSPTANKLQDLAYSVDKNLWQLRAHLQQPSSRRGDLPWMRYQGSEPSSH